MARVNISSRSYIRPSPSIPIDAVFTYVNGENEAYRQEYAAAKGTGTVTDVNDVRCVDHGELALSVFLVFQHVPWVRRVYIVYGGNEIKASTLRQLKAMPEFAARRIRLVPQQDILPPQFQRTFCSCTIESYLHKIPNLAEWFFYLNDDMFVGRPLTRMKYFDMHKKRPIIDLKRVRVDKTDCSQAQRHNTNSFLLFRRRFRSVMPSNRFAVFHHASLMHRPSCEKTLRMFSKELSASHSEPFRTDQTLNFQLLAAMMAERDNFATIRCRRSMRAIMVEFDPERLAHILETMPHLFCINSVTRKTTPEFAEFADAYRRKSVQQSITHRAGKPAIKSATTTATGKPAVKPATGKPAVKPATGKPAIGKPAPAARPVKIFKSRAL